MDVTTELPSLFPLPQPSILSTLLAILCLWHNQQQNFFVLSKLLGCWFGAHICSMPFLLAVYPTRHKSLLQPCQSFSLPFSHSPSLMTTACYHKHYQLQHMEQVGYSSIYAQNLAVDTLAICTLLSLYNIIYTLPIKNFVSHCTIALSELEPFWVQKPRPRPNPSPGRAWL